MWECPDFFPLGDKHVLLISTMGRVHWKVGTYSNQRFTPEKEGIVDWGSCYAAKTMLDANCRRILWGWIPEARPDADLIAAGWAGAMSFPRVLSLNSRNELQITVVKEIQQLRTDHLLMLADPPPASNSRRAFDAVRIKNMAAEIQMQFNPGVDDCSLRLYSDSGDFVSISCREQSGNRELRLNTRSAPLPEPTAPVSLHIFLDGSVLEVFANDTVALTARVYQIPSGPLRLRLDGNAKLLSLNAWQLKGISTDRLAADCAVEA
jgi:beta-fructofuranosidase